MSRSPYQKAENDITTARVHHHLVQNLELVFIGRYHQPQPTTFPIWRTVNEWLVISSICLMLSVAIDFIIRI